jgi:hypothetical protein
VSGSAHHPFGMRACAAAALAVLALTGCTDDSSSPSATSSSAADDSTEATPTEEPSASVTPATGILLKMPHATINAPAGWLQLPDLMGFATEANPPTKDPGAIRLTQLEFPGPEISIDLQAKSALKSRLGDMKREPDVEIAGVTFYHLSGTPSGTDSRLDAYGVLHDGYQTGIDFELVHSVPDAEREKIIAESLATFTWR